MKIFNVNANPATYTSWGQYIRELNNNFNSLIDYIIYNNPDYYLEHVTDSSQCKYLILDPRLSYSQELIYPIEKLWYRQGFINSLKTDLYIFNGHTMDQLKCIVQNRKINGAGLKVTYNTEDRSFTVTVPSDKKNTLTPEFNTYWVFNTTFSYRTGTDWHLVQPSSLYRAQKQISYADLGILVAAALNDLLPPLEQPIMMIEESVEVTLTTDKEYTYGELSNLSSQFSQLYYCLPLSQQSMTLTVPVGYGCIYNYQSTNCIDNTSNDDKLNADHYLIYPIGNGGYYLWDKEITNGKMNWKTWYYDNILNNFTAKSVFSLSLTPLRYLYYNNQESDYDGYYPVNHRLTSVQLMGYNYTNTIEPIIQSVGITTDANVTLSDVWTGNQDIMVEVYYDKEEVFTDVKTTISSVVNKVSQVKIPFISIETDEIHITDDNKLHIRVW